MESFRVMYRKEIYVKWTIYCSGKGYRSSLFQSSIFFLHFHLLGLGLKRNEPSSHAFCTYSTNAVVKYS
jgi:hypothetical protein